MTAKNGTAEKIDVEYVARLARLALDDAEKALFQKQLEDIIGYVNDIASVDVDSVRATASAAAGQNVFRRDEPRPGLDVETVMKNAPAHDGGQFIVPKIV